MAATITPNHEAALQQWRRTNIRQAAQCDREAEAARERNDWVGVTFAETFAQRHRKEAFAASSALLILDRVSSASMARAA